MTAASPTNEERALRALGRAEGSLVAFEKAVALGSGSTFCEMFVEDRAEVARELNAHE